MLLCHNHLQHCKDARGQQLHKVFIYVQYVLKWIEYRPHTAAGLCEAPVSKVRVPKQQGMRKPAAPSHGPGAQWRGNQKHLLESQLQWAVHVLLQWPWKLRWQGSLFSFRFITPKRFTVEHSSLNTNVILMSCLGQWQGVVKVGRRSSPGSSSRRVCLQQ